MATIKEVTSFPDIKVQLVDYNPDMFVYVTKNKFEAKNSDFIWYYDSSPFVDKKIKFVKISPELKIQYVDNKSRAGWKNKTHRLQKRMTK